MTFPYFKLAGARLEDDDVIEVRETFNDEESARLYISIFSPWKGWTLIKADINAGSDPKYSIPEIYLTIVEKFNYGEIV